MPMNTSLRIDSQEQMDSIFILYRLQQEIRDRRDKKQMRLLADQFVRSLINVHCTNVRANHCQSLIKKANELLINIRSGNYSLSMTMIGFLIDSLAQGMSHAEYKEGKHYWQ